MQDNKFYVVKRDGRKEELKIENIRKQTLEACEGLKNVSPEEVEINAKIRFYNGISSKEIQNYIIESAHSLIDIDKPDYTFVAGRLKLYDLYHHIKHVYGKQGSGDVYKKVSIKDYFDKYGHTLDDFYKSYTDEEIEELNSIVDSKKDLLFSYPAVMVMFKTYLNRTSMSNDKIIDKSKTDIVELPQHMFLALAMYNAQHEDRSKRLEIVKEFYYQMSNQYFIPATPQLANGRIKNGGTSSCLVGSVKDNIESVMEGIVKLGFGSKIGAGFGWDISRLRSIGSPINGISNMSQGKIPYCKVLDSLSLYVNQGGKRPGAFAVTIPVWDIDLFGFLDLRKEQNDERLRGLNLNLAINFDDVFMSRLDKFLQEVKNKTGKQNEITYTLFDSYDVSELNDIFGAEFKERYEWHEKNYKENPKSYNPETRTIPIADIVRPIIMLCSREGFPYWTFIDTINEAHAHKQFGKIRTGNLCVHPDTQVLTIDGYEKISTLNGVSKLAWNGTEWSMTSFFDTGIADFYEVKFQNAAPLKVTADHKFHITRNVNGSNQNMIKTTLELLPGDNIIRFSLPVIEEKKKDILEFIKKNFTIIHHNIFNADMVRTTHIIRVMNEEIGKKVMMYVQEAGITAIYRKINNNYHVVAFDHDEYRLACGYEVKIRKAENNMFNTFRVSRVDAIPVRARSYCGHEPKKNLLVFDGVLTGNCQEVVMPADDDEIAVCNLASLNLARLNGDLEKIERATKACLRFLDNSVDVTVYPHPDAEKTQKQRRATGIGMLGEAEYIAHKQIHFGSDEHLDEIDRIYGAINKYSLEATQELAKEKGSCEVEGIRNAYRLCIAPNTTTGLFASTTSGIEPVFRRKFVEEKDNVNRIIMTAPNINIDNYEYYKNAFEIDQYRMLDATARRQKYIDMSISHSIFKDISNLPTSELLDYYVYAWKKKIKTIYYLRGNAPVNKMDEIEIKNNKVVCSGCEN